MAQHDPLHAPHKQKPQEHQAAIPDTDPLKRQAMQKGLAGREEALRRREDSRKAQLASKGGLKSGFGYEQTRRVIMSDPLAKQAYAMADIVGADSKTVEQMGYESFTQHVLDESVNSTTGKWRGKAAEIDGIDARKSPDAEMVKFARALSAVGREEDPARIMKYSDYAQEGQAPSGYITRTHFHFGLRELLPHAIASANTEDDFLNLELIVHDASDRFMNMEPQLQKRAKDAGFDYKEAHERRRREFLSLSQGEE
jgi:hypothetical protein